MVALAGVAAFLWGVLWLATSGGDPTDISCDGQKMTSRDECGNLRHGFKTYDELVERKRSGNNEGRTVAPWLIGVGALVVVGCAVVGLSAGAGSAAPSSGVRPTDRSAGGEDRPWWSEGGGR